MNHSMRNLRFCKFLISPRSRVENSIFEMVRYVMVEQKALSASNNNDASRISSSDPSIEMMPWKFIGHSPPIMNNLS
ncbi:hypothetical protein C2G38_2243900 [Gigaspora rosea]|uniref:Uncharacterized protein n=1 Tax=Gigaspora rosea TaxID=44941 RepID=A0A397VGA5_9GLOM|nr:hypothetical protein C2G38_2243900 [Gigaspora rosea]